MASEDKAKSVRFQKSYFDVLGLCCSSEVPLIEKILKALEGVEKVSVIVPARTVIVVHDNLLVSQTQIVKALNRARLEATVQVFGQEKNGRMWPSKWTVACGILLLLSVFQILYHPLHWLAVAATIVGLPPILLRSMAAIRSLTLDINILMFIAVAGSIALRDYWEAGSIVFLFTIAEWLESKASHKATAVMSSLMSMAPQKAVLAENGLVVDAKDVKVDTILAVKAGEVIPIDGVVVDGKSEVDQRTLTGEPYPVAKQAQSVVWAGTINLDGYIRIKTTTTAEDSAVSRMAKLVEEAQHKKSTTQRFIDKCARYYTPTVVLIAAGVALVPAALRAHNPRKWFHLALVILVSACPCALILSTPIATFCALTKAAKAGILIKGGDYLENLAKVKAVAFDKTGTITRGEFTVTDFRPLRAHISVPTLLRWVSSIESKSSHPMAAALVDYSHANGVEPEPEKVDEFCIFPGEGVYGRIDGKDIYIGNKRIAARAGNQSVPTLDEHKDGSTEGYAFLNGACIGAFRLSDTCRTGVSQAIHELKSMGIKTAMLTGDCHAAAMHVHNQLGHAMDAVHAELLPEEKVRLIQNLKKIGPTAMVGDGMNDAPALATADVGISMGISGSGVAIKIGHITLMSNDIRKIPQAIRLARRTRLRVIENIALSIVTKVGILALALAGHPLLWAAVGADVGTCLVVIFNSMRLLRGATAASKKCSRSGPSSHCHGPSGHKHGPWRSAFGRCLARHEDHGCQGKSQEKCSGDRRHQHGEEGSNCCGASSGPHLRMAHGEDHSGQDIEMGPAHTHADETNCCSNGDHHHATRAKHSCGGGSASDVSVVELVVEDTISICEIGMEHGNGHQARVTSGNHTCCRKSFPVPVHINEVVEEEDTIWVCERGMSHRNGHEARATCGNHTCCRKSLPAPVHINEVVVHSC